MTPGRWILYAPRIRDGGGAVLLRALSQVVGDDGWDAELWVDPRLELPPEASVRARVVPLGTSLVDRLASEKRLRVEAGRGDVVVCLANLPPLYPLAATTFVFLQHRLLIEGCSTAGFSLPARLRLALERAWLRMTARRFGQVFVVQTESMRRQLASRLAPPGPTLVLPFAPVAPGTEPARGVGGAPAAPAPPRPVAFPDKARFLYVASGEPHKNHDVLFEAWAELAEWGLNPTLALTLDAAREAELVGRARAVARRSGARIEVLGRLGPEALEREYRQATALVFPSLLESLGLPLIEARQRGLPVLASERDYVRDSVVPAESFDPDSSRSVARAVARFLGRPPPVSPVLSPQQFLERLRATLA